MLFNSIEFIFFFPIVTLLYFILPYKTRWFWLLAASCYFYMAFVPVYILILFGTIVIDYFAGILIEKSDGKRKKYWLIISLVSNIAILVVFKYYNFFIDNVNYLLSLGGTSSALNYLGILLPIGLSFHTFQAMSYTIEVFRGNQKAEKHFGIYALYVMFYPQLVAGPIERPQNVIHQFKQNYDFDYKVAVSGFKLIAWGFIKKVVIADRLAQMVNFVYDQPENFNGISLIVATVFFSFQIFCDFSGYSDIAIGTARVMGINLMTNFNKPYQSQSISEFWSRWHISLSTWFKDYVYIPLGGNKVKVSRWYFNLAIVFLISGFWHGASWNFVIWGAIHAFYLIFAIVTNDLRKKFFDKIFIKSSTLKTGMTVFTTFVLVAFAWIFFRAKTFNDAIYISTHLFSGWSKDIKLIIENKNFSRMDVLYLGQMKFEFFFAIFCIVGMSFIHRLQNRFSISELISKRPTWQRYLIYQAVILVVLLYGVYEKEQFIYFQF